LARAPERVETAEITRAALAHPSTPPLVWRAPAAPSPTPVTSGLGPWHATGTAARAAHVATTPPEGTSMTRVSLPSRAPSASSDDVPLGRAQMERIADDVMRRIDRRQRIERERRGMG
jgi:hypothetical protein